MRKLFKYVGIALLGVIVILAALHLDDAVGGTPLSYVLGGGQ